MEPFRVSVLAAGGGARFGSKSLQGHKALFRVGKQAVISHILDLFPEDIPVVVALGHNAHLVRQYLDIVHPERIFIYVESKNYGPGFGPAYSLNLCREHLQVPFYSFACDTLMGDFVRDETANWVGYCSSIPQGLAQNYCTLRLNERTELVETYVDKGQDGTDKAWIGLAFILDYATFWDAMRGNTQRVNNEIQLFPALCSLPGLKGRPYRKWYDTGSEEGLRWARECFGGNDHLGKSGEEIYFRGASVVKYFYDPDLVARRIARTQSLGDVVPTVEASSANFYRYAFAQGEDLTRSEEPHRHIERLLEFAQARLWQHVELPQGEQKAFLANCTRFYRDKTRARVQQFYAQEQMKDAACTINGLSVPPLQDVLERAIDWGSLCEGVPSTYHGDFNLSNVILTREGSFKLIDYRGTFGDTVSFGDRYYDLAKLYQSFIWPHVSLRKGDYCILLRPKENAVEVSIEVPDTLRECGAIVEKWSKAKGYDVQKIKALAALSLLNSAPLHGANLGRHLYFLGRSLLSRMFPC